MEPDYRPRIITISEMKLVGMNTRSTANDIMTIELWKKFMPRKKEVRQPLNSITYSVEVFDEVPAYNDKIIPTFTKWGAVEVHDFSDIPAGMGTLIIPAGKYAVFTHIGHSSQFGDTLGYIFGSWLPASGYRLAHRPHFAAMDHRYLGHDNPASEEDIYIPIE